jgi:hypothetical protein
MSSLLVNAPVQAGASPLQVSDLILRMKQRADIEKSGSAGVVSDSEILNLARQGARMLDSLINKTYQYYTMQYWSFATVINVQQYPLPTNFAKLLGIGLVPAVGTTPTSWTPLYHWDMNTQNLAGTGFLYFTNGVYTFMRYRIAGTNVELRPVSSIQSVGIYYTPQAPGFLTTGDYLPPYWLPGWEEYIVNWGALMISAKREIANDFAAEMWKEIKDQISSFIPNRDSANPERVQDAWLRPSMYPAPYGGPFGGF